MTILGKLRRIFECDNSEFWEANRRATGQDATAAKDVWSGRFSQKYSIVSSQNIKMTSFRVEMTAGLK
jgi:hypothetical protein